jgi:arylsulfatase A-like enzyme
MQGFDSETRFFRRERRSVPPAKETHAEAAAWMEAQRRAGRPFFAFVNDMEAHAPHDPPEPFASRFVAPERPASARAAAREMQSPWALFAQLGLHSFGPEERATFSELYDAEMACLDAEIGSLLDRMAASGLLDETLVVVTSDHGEGLGDHGWITHTVRLDRTLLRVPLFVRLHGVFDGGRVVSDVALLEDLLPTVLACCGLPVPPGLDGASLADRPQGRDAWAVERADPVLLQSARLAAPNADLSLFLIGRRSLFDGRMHLIHDEGAAPRLYDTAADPGEGRDIASEQPELVGRMLERLSECERRVRR